MSTTIKFSNVFILAILFLLLNSPLDAGKLYIWTDESGKQHITEQPPPKSAQDIETMKYREKTSAEVAADQAAKREREEYERYLLKKEEIIKEENIRANKNRREMGEYERHPFENTSQYQQCVDGHWISSVEKRGEFVILEDKSVWQIEIVDKIDTVLWLPTDSIIICDDGSIINTENGDIVRAKRIK